MILPGVNAFTFGVSSLEANHQFHVSSIYTYTPQKLNIEPENDGF